MNNELMICRIGAEVANTPSSISGPIFPSPDTESRNSLVGILVDSNLFQ